MFFYEYGIIEKKQKKEDSKMQELLQIHKDSLNSELSEEYGLHKSKNPKGANSDDELFRDLV